MNNFVVRFLSLPGFGNRCYNFVGTAVRQVSLRKVGGDETQPGQNTAFAELSQLGDEVLLQWG